jgi:hypothetical protein
MLLSTRPLSLAAALLAVAAATAACGARAQTAARDGAEEFVLTTTSSAANPVYKMAALGVFKDQGTLDGIGNGQAESLAKLRHGTFVVSHPTANQKVIHESVNPRTCQVVLEERGTFTIDRGTGAYQGITGYGSDKIAGRARLPRGAGGKCDTSASALAVSGTAKTAITANGSVLLPPSG